jgi:carboxypeptidase T
MNLIVKVSPKDERTSLSYILSVPLGVDIWEVKPDHLVLRGSEAQIHRLQQMGYEVEQLHETESFLSRFATAEALAGYHTVQTLEQDLRQLEEKHPEIAELHQIGTSVENRPIWALRIGARKAVGNVRKLLFMGCHHAREWIAVEVPYLLAEHLVNNASQKVIKGWLSKGEFWVAPMVNPDGHEHSRTTERLWRKNRRKNADDTIGVDPNRNYGYMWGTLNVPTSSHVPADETYIGPSAFSEPETRAIRDLVAQQKFRGVITYHSYSQLILYPWGYTNHPIADVADRTQMSDLARRMQKLIKAQSGRVYTAEQSSQLYPTAGDTTDYTYGTYKIPSFTIELRPTSAAEGGFILPASEIEPTWNENKPAAFEFIKRLL